HAAANRAQQTKEDRLHTRTHRGYAARGQAMDQTRSPRSEERPDAPGREHLTSRTERSADVPRDPVTGTPATEPTSYKPDHQKTPEELAQDIRRTRAEMSETVDALERRLSPARLKHEAKSTV